MLLSIPAVQTQLAKMVTERVNRDFGTDLVIKKVDLSFLGSVQLKGVEIRDHHQDTLIFVKNLSTSLLNAKKILDNEVDLGAVSMKGINFHMKTYKGEKDDNLSVFLESFEDGTPKDSTSTPFVLKTKNIYVDGLNYRLVDENKKEPLQFSAANGGGNLQDFSIVGPNVGMKIRGLYLTENRGINVTSLTTDFTYTKTQIQLQKTTLKTKTSKIIGDIEFNYERKDLAYFNDKVKIKGQFGKSYISVKDLHKLYNELSGNDVLNFTGTLKGTLNNFLMSKANMTSKNGMRIQGDMAFVNAVNNERGFIFDGDLKRVTANYTQLKSVLPNLLGKTLPTEFQRLGNFTLSGLLKVTPDQMDATLTIDSEIGTTISDLQLTDIEHIDEANYSGQVEFKDFDLGVFLNDPIVGKISLSGDVEGSGFKIDNINTTVIGEVTSFEFNQYNYQNIVVNGQFKNKLFDGDLQINDEHLKMDFKGLADFSSVVNKFDFTADIAEANLKTTHLFERDSISKLKGKIVFDVDGNTFDDMVGKATFTNIVYTNQKKPYQFKKFEISSEIKDSVKTIEVKSKDIVEGKLKGNFKIAELQPVIQNALGSVYTNYNPHEVSPNQFLDFDFKIYNQIVEVFFPSFSIAPNTKLKGRINANNEALKLVFTSPKIQAYDNVVDQLSLRMDNKNPLFNTHLTAGKVQTKYYNFSKLNLLNRTVNDTLFFKSEFKGGIESTEDFNLDFFYTINDGGNSVLGIEKSTFDFKDHIWSINPKNNKQNKVTFNLKTKEFTFDNFELTSKEQKIAFKGMLRDSTYKKLNFNLNKVKLESFLPPIDSLALKGTLSGNIDFDQNDGVYSPKGTLIVDDFVVNNFEQGDLAVNVRGDNSYEKYAVELSLQNDRVKSIAATGSVDFTNQRPTLDLNVFLEKFQLEAFSPLGQDVLSKLRGEASGSFTLKGFLSNPEMDGLLFLEKAGLKFPYLNVDYDIEGVNTIQLIGQSFVFNDIKLLDTKHSTRGTLKGDITHRNFKSWFLNLTIETDNMLVLDTQLTEESLYYGTGFLKGTARIYGLTDNLTIDVNGVTQPNTTFVIPLSDIKTVDNYRLIYFKTNTKETEEKKEIETPSGLILNIDLEVTKDAEAEVVIDKTSGSALKGRGSGNLKILIDTRGKFEMRGDFEIDKGIYDFKYGGLINKEFDINKGSTISWDGDPFEADLNVEAIYKTKANPAVLLENFNSNRKVDVELITKITGGLFSSRQEFDIRIPNADATVTSELDFKLNNNDANNKTFQFLSLLAFNRFFDENNFGNNSQNLVAGTATGVLTNVLSDIINSKDGKFQFGVGYTQGRRSNVANLNTDNQIDVSVATQLGDRVIVNGKVGVPVGAQTQSSVVGEVKVEVLLNEKGNFRGVIFNRQNEIQFTAEEEGYTQGVGLSYQVNFNTLSELLQKLGLKKKKGKKKNEAPTGKVAKKNPLIKFKSKDQ